LTQQVFQKDQTYKRFFQQRQAVAMDALNQTSDNSVLGTPASNSVANDGTGMDYESIDYVYPG